MSTGDKISADVVDVMTHAICLGRPFWEVAMSGFHMSIVYIIIRLQAV